MSTTQVLTVVLFDCSWYSVANMLNLREKAWDDHAWDVFVHSYPISCPKSDILSRLDFVTLVFVRNCKKKKTTCWPRQKRCANFSSCQVTSPEKLRALLQRVVRSPEELCIVRSVVAWGHIARKHVWKVSRTVAGCWHRRVTRSVIECGHIAWKVARSVGPMAWLQKPVRILKGGSWSPEISGLEPGAQSFFDWCPNPIFGCGARSQREFLRSPKQSVLKFRKFDHLSSQIPLLLLSFIAFI